MIQTITLNSSCCSLSKLCRIENKLSVMLLLMFKPALMWFHKPAFCQQSILRGHRNSSCKLSTPRLFSLARVGNTFRPILHSRFFTFGGILACQIMFQLPAIPVLC
ncbi:hypothetical protein QL285_032502 [Trifolium repens]|nr:hypothetical protein QL285_032502 [Trifolium repens]